MPDPYSVPPRVEFRLVLLFICRVSYFFCFFSRNSLLLRLHPPRRLRRLPLASRSGEHDKHDKSKEKRIECDQRDVAAEVEGQHHANHVEQQSACLLTFQVLTRQDRRPDCHQERRRQRSEELNGLV